MKTIGLLLAVLLIVPLASFGMEKPEEENPLVPIAMSVFVPSRLGTLTLLHNQKEEEFYVDDSETLHKVKSHEIDPLLKSAAKAGALQRFNKVGYISINRHQDGEFSIKSHVRGLGGGRFSKWLFGDTVDKIVDAAKETIKITEGSAKETIKATVDGLDMLGEKHLSALENVGKNAGLETIEAIPLMALKVTGIALTGYTAYKEIDKCYADEKRDINSAKCALDNCLLRNKKAPRNEDGIPLPCQDEACKLALLAGTEIVDEKIKGFNKYTPAPTQTVAQYEAKSQEKPKSKGWLW